MKNTYQLVTDKFLNGAHTRYITSSLLEDSKFFYVSDAVHGPKVFTIT